MIKHKQYPSTPIPEIEKQHNWYLEYSLDAINVGELCEKYPTLENAWSQFKTVYLLCKEEENEVNGEIS